MLVNTRRTEQRSIDRFTIELETTFLPSDGDSSFSPTHCYTRDISSDGAFLYADNPLSVGEELDLEFRLPLAPQLQKKHSAPRLKATGRVVRSERNGMGILFHRSVKVGL